MIGLVDGNNFFVSCERVFAPELEGKAVAVLSNNDGCCISRSNEFKQLGIAMGTPYFQLKERIARDGLHLLSSNYALYGDMSRRIISVLQEFVPSVEQYSIDEAFIHPQLPDDADFLSMGIGIRQTILKWIGIPCGVGFAPSKTLAKIANHIAKKLPDGVFVMPEDPQVILEKIPVSEVWGVGRKLAPKLERLGIRNAGDLARQEPEVMQKKFSVIVARTVMELRGTACIEEDVSEGVSQSISVSRSFGQAVYSFEELAESVAFYTASAACKLRKEGQVAAGANVYFQMYGEFGDPAAPAAINTVTVMFDHPTDDTGLMNNCIQRKLKKIYIPNRRYKKSGVIFWGLESASCRQLDLFAPQELQKPSSLYQVVDKLNACYGKNTVFNLSEGIKRPWQMRREHLSRNYTGSWDELMTAT